MGYALTWHSFTPMDLVYEVFKLKVYCIKLNILAAC